MHSAIFIFLHLLCFPRSHVFGIICPIVAGIFDIHMSTHCLHLMQVALFVALCPSFCALWIMCRQDFAFERHPQLLGASLFCVTRVPYILIFTVR